MPTITITGDTTQEALEQILYKQIGKYGKDLNLHISENLRFENQNKEIKELKKKVTKWSDSYFTVTSGRHKLLKLMELKRENDELKEKYKL